MDQHPEEQSNAGECSSYCKGKCPVSFSTWTKECIDALKTEFHKKTLIEKKNAVLSHIKKQDFMMANGGSSPRQKVWQFSDCRSNKKICDVRRAIVT